MQKKHRKSKYEILRELFKDQEEDSRQTIIWHEVITPYVLREYDFLAGKSFRHKTFDVLFRLNWKDEWISKAMRVSIRTVQRVRREFKKLVA